jgi:hypothetical protein
MLNSTNIRSPGAIFQEMKIVYHQHKSPQDLPGIEPNAFNKNMLALDIWLPKLASKS